jgi:hypothetical protein
MAGNKMISATVIEIKWQGPFTIKAVIDGTGHEVFSQKGLYQIYGPHPVNGHDNLLYIGRTHGSFCQRFRQHYEDWIKDESAELEIYLGVIEPPERSTIDAINKAEALLIYYCSPPYNSQHISDYRGEEVTDGNHTIVLNFFRKKLLPYEVSTLWYHSDIWKLRDKLNEEGWKNGVR